MVTYLSQYFEDTLPSEAIPDLSILDLGTGNGHLLFSLLEADIDPPLEASRMRGVDYSAASIDLAKAIAATREDERCKDVAFEEADLLDPSHVERLQQSAPLGSNDSAGEEGWPVVCDKGTFDAIALSSQPVRGQLPIDLYAQAVKTLTRPGGIFLITSCNFTQEELVARFSGKQDAAFEVEKVVPTPTFSFVSLPVQRVSHFSSHLPGLLVCRVGRKAQRRLPSASDGRAEVCFMQELKCSITQSLHMPTSPKFISWRQAVFHSPDPAPSLATVAIAPSRSSALRMPSAERACLLFVS